MNSSSSTNEHNRTRNINHPIVVHSSKPLHSKLNNAPLVFTWGRGEDGQLGLGDTNDMHEPTFVDSLRGVHVKQLACGSGHTCILTEEGQVLSMGRGDDGRLGHGDNGWKYVPRLVNALMGKVVSLVTCGSYHTAAVTNGGELFTMGGGMYGKLGHGDESGCSLPRKVEAGLTGIHIVNVACGSRHTACLSSDGKLYSWGDKGVSGHGDIEGKNNDGCLEDVCSCFFIYKSKLSTFNHCVSQNISTHQNWWKSLPTRWLHNYQLVVFILE